jgi:3-deoxy-manno-octulosonate cytidylyltransferase (CMP-KDO synthetase)
MTIETLCVIPARYASTRLPAKPLCNIDGKPLIIWVYNRAVDSGAFDKVVVATDHEQIFSVVKTSGGEAIMTSADHPRGTDRVFEVVEKIPCKFVVNLQGDEPDVPVDVLQDFSNEVKKIDDNTLLTIASHATMVEGDNPNVVKVVLDQYQKALYFSRSRIPFDRDKVGAEILKHKGIYGFSSGSLRKFCSFPQGKLEKYESLEQLRALEYGMAIRCIIRDFESTGIDTPEDLERFRCFIATGTYEQR